MFGFGYRIGMTEITVTRLKLALLANKDERGKIIPQHKVAGATGINPSTLSEYSLGKQPFTQKNLRKLCEYFQCDVNDLAGWVTFTIPDEETPDRLAS